jgi:hypothetical protein
MEEILVLYASKKGLLDVVFDPGNSGLGDVSDMATPVVNLGHKELVRLPNTFIQVREFWVEFVAKHCHRRGGHAVEAFVGSRDAGFQGDKARVEFFANSLGHSGCGWHTGETLVDRLKFTADIPQHA